MTFSRSLDMALTREEFLRVLRSVVEGFEIVGETASWFEAGRLWSIRLIPLAERRIGNVTLPRHRVEIVLEASDAEGEAFMTRFRRGFLRGGG